MAKKIGTRPVGAGTVGPRQLVLAGLGAVSLARKQAIKSFDAVVTGSGEVRDVGLEIASGLLADASERASVLRQRVERRIEPVLLSAQAHVGAVVDELKQRAAPVLGRFGVQVPTAARKKAAGTRATARRAARGHGAGSRRSAA